jgi:3D (Asp-Asp-Asp) domain-containing protein
MLKTAAFRLFATTVVLALLALLIAVSHATANTPVTGRFCAAPSTAEPQKNEAPVVVEPETVTPPRLIKLGPEVVGTTLTMKVTGYTSTVEQTDSTPCIASDLTNVCERKRRGELICAASREFPLGTRLKIPGLGTCVVADYMPAHRRASADWYFGEDPKGDDTRYRRAMKIDKKVPRQVTILSIPE